MKKETAETQKEEQDEKWLRSRKMWSLKLQRLKHPLPEEELHIEVGSSESGDDCKEVIGRDLAGNKVVVLKRMASAQRKIIRAQAKLGEQTTAFSERMQHQQQQIESYLQLATRLHEQEYREEGSKALIDMIAKWQLEAMLHIRAWMEEEKREEKG